MPLLDAAAPQDVRRAADILAQGGLLAFATETVYGLGARADDDAAVSAIFRAKGRPVGHPLIVHVASVDAAHGFASELPPVARRLMAAFWPGPLTVVVARRAGVATAAAGGHPTIGLRCPGHPAALALLEAAAALGVSGVAAPSANRFGRTSPTTAAHVVAELGAELAVLDAGPCPVGIESTIVDCSRGRAVLLRPGVLSRAEIEAAAGVALEAADAQAPRASGDLSVHYAPRATVRLMATADLRTALTVMAQAASPAVTARMPAVYARTVAVPPALRSRPMPDEPRAAAQHLFAALRAFDDDGVGLLWVEAPPDGSDWDGVRDRLQRAAAAGEA